MKKEIHIKDALSIWASHSMPRDTHLTTERLFAFSLPGGLGRAKDDEISHLSLCTVCLDTWKLFCDINNTSASDDYDQADDFEMIGTGRLQAAAGKTVDAAHPREYKSSCGRFILTIFPEPDDPQTAMITLDTTGNKNLFQNKTATLRDAKGMIFLKRALHHGRAAVITDRLESLDLSFWTVFLSPSSLKGNHE